MVLLTGTPLGKKATKLIDQDKVVTVWLLDFCQSQNVPPVFEQKDHMLWYPVVKVKSVPRTSFIPVLF